MHAVPSLLICSFDLLTKCYVILLNCAKCMLIFLLDFKLPPIHWMGGSLPESLIGKSLYDLKSKALNNDSNPEYFYEVVILLETVPI